MDFYDALMQGIALRQGMANQAEDRDLRRRDQALRAALERRQMMETEIHRQNLQRQYQRENFQEATPELGALRTLAQNYPGYGISEQISDYASAGRRMARRGPATTVQADEAVPLQDAIGVQDEPMEGVRDAAAARAMAIAAETKREQEDRTWGNRAALKAQGQKSLYEKEAHDNYKAALKDARKLRSEFSAFKTVMGADKAMQQFSIASEAELDALIEAKVQQVQAQFFPVFARLYGSQQAREMMGQIERMPEGMDAPPRQPPARKAPAGAAPDDGFQPR